ncbi:exo-alpha-sialidase [Tenacibaculum maritimum]|uniref:exo-alpha-sialidase n=1 Tax=Tenacibaculum maritimum TaxID=107401 RepID=UPI003875BACB
MKHRIPLFFLILFLSISSINAQSGKFLQLDGVNDFMEVLDHSDLDIDSSEDFTVTARIRSNAIGDYYRILSKRDTNGVGYEMFVRNTNGTFATNLGSTSGTGSGPGYGTTVVQDGLWHHVAFVVNRATSTSKIYVDGNLQDTKALSSIATANFANATNFTVGKKSSWFYNGNIDEVRVWSKAMTENDLVSDMTTVLNGSESDLLAAWNFENVTGTSVPDITGNGHTGTLYGGASIIDHNNPTMFFSSATLSNITTIPVGKGNQNEGVALVNISTSGGLNPLKTTALNISLAGTKPSNINTIKVYYTGSNKTLSTTTLFGTANPSNGDITIHGSQDLLLGNNYFWVTYDISNTAIEGDTMDAAVNTVTVGGNIEPLNTTNVSGSRLILLEHNQLWKDGDNGAARYRIPAITTALDGTLIAAIDKRYAFGDLNDNTNIDIVIKRSTDGGKTWSDEITVADFGVVNGVHEGASDPAIITDRNTGDIIILYLGYNGIFGSSPSNRSRVFMSRSSDNGLTWSTPSDISDDVYPTGWYMSWVASGSFSQTRSGRLIAVVTSRQNSSRTLSNHLIYSDDGGYNWSIEKATPYSRDGDESKVVELANGDLLMNMRRSGGYRYISKSTDGGTTWSPQTQETQLPDPRNNADLIRYTSVNEGFNKNRLLFSNARTNNSPRKNVNVYLSIDEGVTWPSNYQKQIYAGNADYTTMTILENGDIGMLYETRENGGFQIVYARFSLDWLTSGADSYMKATVPNAASNLTASNFGNSVNLSWKDNATTELGFEIYRSTTNGTGYTLIAKVPADTTTYTDLSTSLNSTYYYVVKAYNSGGVANPTNEVSVTTNESTPIILNAFPKKYQLYPRGTNNKALVTIAGTATNAVDSLITKVYRPNGIVSRIAMEAQTNFSFTVEIDAILHDYSIELFAKSTAGVETLVKKSTHITAGDVYVINGQSNAWAIDYDNAYNDQDLPASAKWVRTIGAMHVYNKPAIQPEASNTDWFLARGKAPNLLNGEYVGNGMVGVLGINIGIHLVSSENVPIAIINGAGGGGAISFYQKTTNNDLDKPYGRLQYRLENSGLKDAVKAFIWNQGENNAGDTTAAYKTALNQLYNSLKSDYNFNKFYLIQTPPGCNSSNGHQTIREAQRQFVAATPNTRILTRHGFSPDPKQPDGNYFLTDGCHYHEHAYKSLANWISKLAAYDFYGATVNYEAPKLVKVLRESANSLVIEFDKNVEIQPDLTVNGNTYAIKDYAFAINKTRTSAISEIELVSGNPKRVRLSFSGQDISNSDQLTYILDDNYPATSIPYRGPWIVDANTKVGAVGFTKGMTETDHVTYCTPNAIASSNAVFIDYVKFNTSPAFDVSSGNIGYEDHTSKIIQMTPGENYTLNIGAGNPTALAPKRLDIWIDYNQDGVFHPTDELFLGWGSNSYTNTDLLFSNKKVAENALPGKTRMRIALKASNSASNPCDSFTNGEIEDYTVEFASLPYCGKPTITPSSQAYISRLQINEQGGSQVFGWNSGNEGYADRTQYTCSVMQTLDYALTLNIEDNSTAYRTYVAVWADFNKDGDFDDAGEQIIRDEKTTGAGSVTYEHLTIPNTASIGDTRLRVMLKSESIATNSGHPLPCDTIANGEVEDITLNISAVPPSITPEVTKDLFVSSGTPFSTSGTPHTFRIPSLITSNKGTLLAFADERLENSADVPADVNIVLRRSTDNGNTWGPSITAITSHSGDASTVVDKATGRIYLFYIYSLHKTIFHADPDTSSPNSFHTRYVYSDDDGLTWSDYIDITDAVKKPTELAVWAGAGRGIQMRNGTLLIPIVISTTSSASGLKGAFIYSTDHGATWKRSAGTTVGNFNENTIEELNDGRLMMNSRNSLGYNARAISYTADFGATWTAPVAAPTLIDPYVQGNLIRYTSTLDGYDKDRLLFSNPASTSSRSNNTVRISYDEGQTWAYSKLYQFGGGGYSCLTVLDNGKIGVLYEVASTKGLRFKRFSLEDLTDNTDTFKSLSYCKSTTNPNPNSGGITRLQIIDHTGTGSTLLDNASEEVGYDDQTAIAIPSLNAGTTYRISFTTTNTSNDRKFVAFWADFNGDGDFDDEGENMENWSSDTYTSNTYQFSNGLVIPTSAIEGPTRFRVAYKTEEATQANSGAPTACGTFSYGEIEDYTIAIKKPTASTKSYSFDNFSLYPIPSKGTFNLGFKTEGIGNVSVKLLDMNGRLIEEKLYKNTSSYFSETLSFKGVDSGVYILHITNNNKQSVSRITFN